MEIREGYKKTEVGVIPGDWEFKSLDEITILMTNGFVGTVKQHYIGYGAGVLYIQGYNVEENSFNFHGIKKVTTDFHKRNMKSCLQEDDLLTVQTGDVGLTTIVPKELTGSNCHALIISRFQRENFSPKFFSFYFNSYKGRTRLKEIETGSTMKHINVGTMKNFLVPIPPLPEQKAIVSALSDIDALISSLTKLINIKKSIKQGVMQKLLTGKNRLEGFSGDWKYVDLNTIAKITIGLVTTMTTNYVESGTLLIRNSDIMPNKIKENGLINLDNEFADKNKNRKFMLNDIVTVHTGDVGTSAVINEKMCGSIGFATLNTRLKKGIMNPAFLCAYLNSTIYKSIALEMSTGDGRNNLNLKDFEKSKIPLPPTLEEQTAIAEILSDMDNEIESLQIKLTKYKSIKQGMMQELLTGRIRLVEEVKQ